ncbi:MAG: manganese efflux pump MntP family protein [Oscillospiraceae bacterium]|nr:manganese efflux pump MntP family protein [Oscillospiraceae bacterium]
MNIFVLFALAIGLSMDAFAVSVCIGLSMKKVMLRNAILVGLYFGFFQAAMPLIGYIAGSQFADMITAFDHWIAFCLLAFLGGKMIYSSFKKEEPMENEESMENEEPIKKEASLGPKKMLPLAIATSIDALAVGISFAFLQVNILSAVLLIGITTFILSAAGVKIGSIFGIKFKSKAELLGGIILILIGTNILLDHLGVYG